MERCEALGESELMLEEEEDSLRTARARLIVSMFGYALQAPRAQVSPGYRNLRACSQPTRMQADRGAWEPLKLKNESGIDQFLYDFRLLQRHRKQQSHRLMLNSR